MGLLPESEGEVEGDGRRLADTVGTEQASGFARLNAQVQMTCHRSW